MSSFLFTNIAIATMSSDIRAAYGLIENGTIAVQDGKILWVGNNGDAPDDYRSWPSEDFGGRLVTPALIDCHTHLVFGGNRAKEFEMRLEGVSYEEISRQGGGILSTVKDTCTASEEELVEVALPRLDALLSEGVSVVEIKSGYGLTIEDELKMLRAARKLATRRNVKIKTTFLGAHALPEIYKGRADQYIDEVCLPALEKGIEEGLIDAVDAFCEKIAFTPQQVARVFDHAKKLGVPVKIHAEQLSNLNGAALAASYGALSADHLEYLDEAGVKAMKEAGTIAVLLPGAFYTLRETQAPPVDLLRQYDVSIAIATDCNPGSSPLFSLLLTMNMSCTLFGLTPEGALKGVTCNAAKALGIEDSAGTIETGKNADFAIWDVQHPAELSYRIGYNPLYKRFIAGEIQ